MTEPTEPEDDLSAALSSAFDAAEAAETAPPATDAPGPAAEASVRDEHGRFAPKAGEPTPTDPAAQPAPEADPQPIRAPASWSAQAKADFAVLPQHIQQEVLKREADVTKGFEERAAQLKRYEPLEAVIAPHRDRLKLAGVSEDQYLGTLVHADEMLRGPNRAQALLQIAQSYGIDLQALAGGGGQPQAQPDPYGQRISTLEQQLASQHAAAEQATATEHTRAVVAFAADPQHMYFPNVRQAMAQLITSGAATDLKDAYDKATWADPAIRPLLIKAQAEDQAKAQAAAQQQRAQAARAASGSVVGSPQPGSAPAGGPPPTIEESLAKAWDAAA